MLVQPARPCICVTCKSLHLCSLNRPGSVQPTPPCICALCTSWHLCNLHLPASVQPAPPWICAACTSLHLRPRNLPASVHPAPPCVCALCTVLCFLPEIEMISTLAPSTLLPLTGSNKKQICRADMGECKCKKEIITHWCNATSPVDTGQIPVWVPKAWYTQGRKNNLMHGIVSFVFQL